MVDDLEGVSESGMMARKLNALINVKTAEKKLNFGPDKCYTVQNAHKHATNVNYNLYINKWSETHDRNDHLIETFVGKVSIERSSYRAKISWFCSFRRWVKYEEHCGERKKELLA